jgi:hypothetical protein
MNVKERLKDFIRSNEMSVIEFERSISVANGYVNSISRSIGINKIVTMLEKYPNINIEWLLTGKGTMLKSATIAHENETTRLRCRNDLLEKQINTLIEAIDVLAATNKKLQTDK